MSLIYRFMNHQNMGRALAMGDGEVISKKRLFSVLECNVNFQARKKVVHSKIKSEE